MTQKVLVKLKRKESISWDGQQLIVSINAAPIKGAANKRLVHFLAEWLDLAPSLIAVKKGHISRHKIVTIDLDEIEVRQDNKNTPKVS